MEEQEVKPLTMLQRLNVVQNELKAPKGQYNSFGKYAYRSCEDILEALKPLLKKYDLTLQFNDSIQAIGDNLFLKTELYLHDSKEPEKTTCLRSSAYAGHELTKKGMDFAQITGAASSYARKYALGAVFLIDDTKDSDATNTHGKELQQPQQNDKALQDARHRLIEAINAWCIAHNADPKKAMQGITKRPNYEQTVEFFNETAKEFEDFAKKVN